MKKITSLLMVVAAWLCATVAVADDSTSETTTTFTVATTPTTYENITTGYYVVKAKGKGCTGFIKYESGNSFPFQLNYSSSEISSITDSSYVWYITKTDNGLVWQSASSGAYLPADADRNKNCQTQSTLANAAVLQSSNAATYDGALESGFTLKQMNNSPYTEPLNIHVNDLGTTTKKVSYWDGGAASATGSLVEFAVYGVTNYISSHISKALATKTTITDSTTSTATTTVVYRAVKEGEYSLHVKPAVDHSYYYGGIVNCTSENKTVSESNATFTGTVTELEITDEITGPVPFELSSEEKPVWYTVKFRNQDAKYLVHQAKTDNNMSSAQSFKSFTDWTKFTGSLWAFVQSGYGVKVLCKQTGTYVTLAYSTNSTKATLSADGSTFIVKTNSSNSSAGFSLKMPDETNAYIGDHASSTLGVWNNGSAQNDGGSSWTIEKADASEAILTVGKTCVTTYANAMSSLAENYITTFSATSVQKAKEAANTATSVTQLEAAYNTIDFTQPDAPVAGNYYRIVNANSITKKYITSESISVSKDGTLSASDDRTITRTSSTGAYAPMLWSFEAQTDGTYYIRNANNGGAWCNNSSSALTIPADDTTVGGYTLSPISGTTTNFYIKLGNNFINAWYGDTQVESKNIIREYNDNTSDKGSYWMFEKVTSVPVTISAANYATVCYPFAVLVADTSNVKAYYTQQVEDGTMTLVEIEDGIIPANTGVVLYHDGATTTTFALTTTEKTLTGNKLDGVTAERTGYTSLETYVLALNSNNKAAFCQSELTVIPANKAYLKASNIGSTTVGTESINFDFNKVDGIGLTPSAEQQRTKYYDLNGRAVPYPVHGIFVTDKGKKVLIP